MKLKRIVVFFLLMAVLCVSSLSTAMAAEPVNDSENSMLSVRVESAGLYEITVNGNLYYFNNSTGEVTNSDGDIIARIINEDPMTHFYSLSASRPTSAQHGMTLGSRWIYSYSQWSTVECYVEAQEEVISAITSFFISAGLSAYLGPDAADAIGDAAGEYLAWLNTNNLDISENAFYVREYVYCNRYILSNFAEIYQGYCTDYTPLNVITYDQEITY